MDIKTISIVGSGNLATQLAKAFYKKGIAINQIFSPNIKNGVALASLVNSKAINNFDDLAPVDLIIIAVSDSAISEISNSLQHLSCMVVHTSGSTSIDIFHNRTNFGVFYPFQTFSKNVDIEFTQIPILIEANTLRNQELLICLATILSSNVQVVNSLQRLKLHLAGVFASNFSNHMYAIAHQLLNESGLSFEMVKHLIEETTRKALQSNNPALVQTGPASRNNFHIMESHKELIADRPLWQKIYTFVSDSIMDMQKR
jgi:predicted short-subunit dehydrogenase-like oxidoreductase (DUF2520 family)